MGIVVHIVDAGRPGDFAQFKSKSTRSKGDIVIKLGPMCNGVGQALDDVRRRTGPNSIDALIIYGHGPDGGGAIGVSMGNNSGPNDQYLNEVPPSRPRRLPIPKSEHR